jgi:hypothetical protein
LHPFSARQRRGVFIDLLQLLQLLLLLLLLLAGRLAGALLQLRALRLLGTSKDIAVRCGAPTNR